MNNLDGEDDTERIDIIREKTIKKQLRQIYLDQERRRRIEEKKNIFLEKWGCIFACCLV